MKPQPVHSDHLTAEQIERIRALWSSRKFDTLDIAERVGVKEHQVYSCIHWWVQG